MSASANFKSTMWTRSMRIETKRIPIPIECASSVNRPLEHWHGKTKDLCSILNSSTWHKCCDVSYMNPWCWEPWLNSTRRSSCPYMLCMTKNHALNPCQIEFLKWGLCSWLFNEWQRFLLYQLKRPEKPYRCFDKNALVKMLASFFQPLFSWYRRTL